MNAIPGYPKITHLGQCPEVFTGTVEITEKVDGSQFGFGIGHDGRLVMRSKGVELHPPVDGMFAKAVEEVQLRESEIRHALTPGEFVYGEYLSKPKHNTLAYDRVPRGHIALFGVYNDVDQDWCEWELVARLAEALGFDCVPRFRRVRLNGVDDRDTLLDLIRAFMEHESFLGGEKIEGVVVKNYEQRIDRFGHIWPVFSKYVSADFKERHNTEWKPERDKLADYVDGYCAPARWTKAVHAMRDAGVLQNDARDIGALIRRVQEDLHVEEAETIASDLYKHFRPQINRAAVRGLPEWYKQRLAESRELVTSA